MCEANEMNDRMTDKPDWELLKLTSSDPEAFGEFYRRHVAATTRYFMSAAKHPQDAADLTAETFAAALVSASRYKETGAPAASWLMGIASHQLKRYLRRRRVETRARERLGIPQLSLDDYSYERIEEQIDSQTHVLYDAIRHMSPRARDAVLLRVGLDLGYEDVAERLGCSVGAARVRVTRGLSQMSRRIGA